MNFKNAIRCVVFSICLHGLSAKAENTPAVANSVEFGQASIQQILTSVSVRLQNLKSCNLLSPEQYFYTLIGDLRRANAYNGTPIDDVSVMAFSDADLISLATGVYDLLAKNEQNLLACNSKPLNEMVENLAKTDKRQKMLTRANKLLSMPDNQFYQYMEQLQTAVAAQAAAPNTGFSRPQSSAVPVKKGAAQLSCERELKNSVTSSLQHLVRGQFLKRLAGQNQVNATVFHEIYGGLGEDCLFNVKLIIEKQKKTARFSYQASIKKGSQANATTNSHGLIDESDVDLYLQLEQQGLLGPYFFTKIKNIVL